jgi:hypothetical protein
MSNGPIEPRSDLRQAAAGLMSPRELGIEDEVAAQTAEWEAGQHPVFVPGLGVVSSRAAEFLTSVLFGGPSMFPAETGDVNRCYRRAGYTVHVQPWCRCGRSLR